MSKSAGNQHHLHHNQHNNHGHGHNNNHHDLNHDCHQHYLDPEKRREQKYKETFNFFDKDGSGMISFAEFRRAFKILNVPITNAEIKELIQALDGNGDGQVSYNEFLNMMSDDLLLRVFSNDELEEIFNFYDKDKSGFITEVELEEAFKRLGRPLDKNTIKTMVGTYDLNNDGKISFDEFKSLM